MSVGGAGVNLFLGKYEKVEVTQQNLRHSRKWV